MQRIACYSALALISIVSLAGCSSGWTFANWKEALTFRTPKSNPSRSVVELQKRAQQLEQIQEYKLAKEVYTEILAQDPDNQVAQLRMAALQRMGHQPANQPPYGSTGREAQPVSRGLPGRQKHHDRLPEITPASPSKSQSIAMRDRAARTSRPLPTSTPGENSMSELRGAKTDDSEGKQPAPKTRKRIPLDQIVKRQEPQAGSGSGNHNVSSTAGTVNMAELIQQPGQQHRNAVAQTSMKSTAPNTLILPEIIPAGSSVPRDEAVTLMDIQKRLSTHPADPSAIETLIQGIRTEGRAGCWEISSTVGVLIQNSDARSLIVDSLSRALVDEEPLMRKKTALVIASLGADGADLLPALERRLNDRDESVRQAAAFAIEEIR